MKQERFSTLHLTPIKKSRNFSIYWTESEAHSEKDDLSSQQVVEFNDRISRFIIAATIPSVLIAAMLYTSITEANNNADAPVDTPETHIVAGEQIIPTNAIAQSPEAAPAYVLPDQDIWYEIVDFQTPQTPTGTPTS